MYHLIRRWHQWKLTVLMAGIIPVFPERRLAVDRSVIRAFYSNIPFPSNKHV
jgi:hypothetical protein